VTVSNGTAPDATQNFTLAIRDTPYIVTAGLAKGTVGVWQAIYQQEGSHSND